MKRLLILLGALGLLWVAQAWAAGTTVSIGSGGGGSSGSLLTTITNRNPVDGSDPCNTGDLWFNTATSHIWMCTNGATDDWTTSA